MGKAIFEQSMEKDREFEIAASIDDECSFCEREFDGVKVTVCADMKSRLPDIMKEYVKVQQVAVVYIDDVVEIARSVALKLNISGWRVFELSLPRDKKAENQAEMLSDIPDYIKFVLAVGSGRISELAAGFGSKHDCEFALFATAPSTDCFLNLSKLPSFIVADSNVLKNCPKSLIAAGVSILLSEPLKEFERGVESLLYETSFAVSDIKMTNKFAYEIMTNDYSVDAVELFFKLLRLSSSNNKNKFVSSAEILATILSRTDGSRNLGEYVFVASYLLASFYISYLTLPTESTSENCVADIMMPPDRIKTMKLLEKKCGMDFCTLVKRVDIFPSSSYFRIKYMINEYREELLKSLNSLDFRAAQKFWKRQYSDAGFWIQETFTAKELLSLMSLSGELAGGLLGFAKASGILENYI